MKRILYGVLFLTVSVSQAVGAAGIYKWKDVDGRIHIGDRPPPASSAEQISVRPVNTFGGIATPDSDANAGTTAGATEKVVIYTTQRCGYCNKAKAYFRNKGVAYSEYDVETSSKGRRDYKKLQGRGVPIIMVGSKRLNGFSESRLSAVLQAAGYSL